MLESVKKPLTHNFQFSIFSSRLLRPFFCCCRYLKNFCKRLLLDEGSLFGWQVVDTILVAAWFHLKDKTFFCHSKLFHYGILTFEAIYKKWNKSFYLRWFFTRRLRQYLCLKYVNALLDVRIVWLYWSVWKNLTLVGWLAVRHGASWPDLTKMNVIKKQCEKGEKKVKVESILNFLHNINLLQYRLRRGWHIFMRVPP